MRPIPVVPLAELMAPRLGTVDPSDYPDEKFDYYSIPAYDSGKAGITAGREIGSAKQLIQPNDVLLSRIVPHIRRAWVVAPQNGHRIIGSGEWIVFRSDRIYPPYLRQLFLSDSFHPEFMRTVAGVGGSLLRARPASVARIQIPLPAIEEQRRIAAILDKAEALRAKRSRTLDKLENLRQSLFLEMFGDPANANRVWGTQRLRDLLEVPLRNGLSPSNTGTIAGSVLTLSAITGARFNASAIKEAKFHVAPPLDQTVDWRDLLICRGNGNLKLVGKGQFPTATLVSVLFPDTMIGARISSAEIEREFLQCIWNSSAVRGQIEKVARTTNGTHKVNQTMLEEIELISPPLDLQREFSKRSRAIKGLCGSAEDALMRVDSVFASLQSRAFRGEL